MYRRLSVCFAGLASVAGLLLSSAPAQAYDVLALECPPNPFLCEYAPIKFSHTDALPIEWSFDTGWIPQGSPLQVHIYAGIYAHTTVALSGVFVTEWPEAFTLHALGDKNGGSLSYHYGAEFGAEALVDVTVLGQHFTWQGDIPYIPQFDFQLEAEKQFDAWGYPPGVELSSITQTQKIASVGIGDIIGGSIPGIDGGFELDVALELKATYTTDQIVVTTTDGKPVEGGPFTSADGKSSTPYLSGPSIELDVHPEGTVSYDGVVHIIPAFYVELLGNNWNIPIADIPITFPITDLDFIFDAQRVHTPLPDLVLPKDEIDFGVVEVGQKSLITYSLWNAGEARAATLHTSTDPVQFEPFEPGLVIDPGQTGEASIRFVPTKPGTFEATLYIASNDPSDPVQTILLKGIARGGLTIAAGEDGFGSVTDDGSCACKAAGGGRGSGGISLAFAAIAVGGLAFRRRARSKA